MKTYLRATLAKGEYKKEKKKEAHGYSINSSLYEYNFDKNTLKYLDKEETVPFYQREFGPIMLWTC